MGEPRKHGAYVSSLQSASSRQKGFPANKDGPPRILGGGAQIEARNQQSADLTPSSAAALDALTHRPAAIGVQNTNVHQQVKGSQGQARTPVEWQHPARQSGALRKTEQQFSAYSQNLLTGGKARLRPGNKSVAQRKPGLAESDQAVVVLAASVPDDPSRPLSKDATSSTGQRTSKGQRARGATPTLPLGTGAPREEAPLNGSRAGPLNYHLVYGLKHKMHLPADMFKLRRQRRAEGKENCPRAESREAETQSVKLSGNGNVMPTVGPSKNLSPQSPRKE